MSLLNTSIPWRIGISIFGPFLSSFHFHIDEWKVGEKRHLCRAGRPNQENSRQGCAQLNWWAPWKSTFVYSRKYGDKKSFRELQQRVQLRGKEAIVTSSSSSEHKKMCSSQFSATRIYLASSSLHFDRWYGKNLNEIRHIQDDTETDSLSCSRAFSSGFAWAFTSIMLQWLQNALIKLQSMETPALCALMRFWQALIDLLVTKLRKVFLVSPLRERPIVM